MKPTFFVAACLLTVAGCAHSPTVNPSIQYVVVSPPAEFLQCPTLKSYPDADTLTNAQVAAVIVQLDRNNRTCKVNMDKVKEFIAENKKASAKK